MASLAPGLLVAAPPLSDPNFDQSVVLLGAHSDEGAFGWVINGQHVMDIAELLERTGVSDAYAGPTAPVRLGGPVGREQVWLLYPTEARVADLTEQFDVGAGITASSSQRVLHVIAEGGFGARLVGVVGYAGWAPSQLENEIRGGAWLPTDADASLLFDVEGERVWQAAYERIGATPMAFVSRTVGQA